jgi:acyl-ACP thioesterase
MIYQHEIEENIRHHECDAEGKLKLHSLLDRLQDAAAEHAATLNVGMDELAEMRLIWVLSRLKISLFEPLELGCFLKVLTRPTGVQRIFAHRCYELIADGKRLGIAGSFWLPVNTVSGRPVNAKKVLPADILDVPETEKFFSDMDKLPEVSSPVCASYKVGAGDVDLNRHLNNAVYARWVTDLLGEKLKTFSPQVKEIQLNYLSPGQFGETIELRCDVDGDGNFLISGEKSGGTAVFQAAGIVSL